MKKNLLINIDEDLHKRIKVTAAKHGISITKLIVDAFNKAHPPKDQAPAPKTQPEPFNDGLL